MCVCIYYSLHVQQKTRCFYDFLRIVREPQQAAAMNDSKTNKFLCNKTCWVRNRIRLSEPIIIIAEAVASTQHLSYI